MVGGVSVTVEDVTVKVGASVMVGGASVMVGGASVMVGGVSVMVGVNVLVEDVTVMVGGVSGDVADVYNVLCLPAPGLECMKITTTMSTASCVRGTWAYSLLTR